jgi:N-formylglutamate deformylase
MNWLTLRRGDAPLIISFPHTGIELPADIEPRLVSLWRARKDTDWYVDRLYEFVYNQGVTIIHTAISRTMIDVNRDVTGRSLYPGRPTTELCPTTTFDGEPLYKPCAAPTQDEIAERSDDFFRPYHQALSEEVRRLRQLHPRIVLYDCHSIRSRIPRLFEGELPHFNIGTNSGTACDGALAQAIAAQCARTSFSCVVDGRFKGGSITRSFGKMSDNVHAIQMELACRSYMREPVGVSDEHQWPPPYDVEFAAPMRAALSMIIEICLGFSRARN